MHILVAQINPTIADLDGNAQKIVNCIEEGKKEKVSLVLFPELVITGYPPEDFLLLPHFLDAVDRKLEEVVMATEGITAIVGVPRRALVQGREVLFNSAAVLNNGKLVGFQDKVLLPTYDVFNERRYFYPGIDKMRLWELGGKRVAITICEDIWGHTPKSLPAVYLHNVIEDLLPLQPDLVVNLSASPFSTVKALDRYGICRNAAETLAVPVVLCNQVGGNDSLIFDGYSLYVGANGDLLGTAPGFVEASWVIDTDAPSQPQSLSLDDAEEIYRALVLGVRDYFSKTGFHTACLGLSGGIDSAVTAVIAAEALGKENVVGVIMPSRYTASTSIEDAYSLAKNVGIATKEISIEPVYASSLELLAPHFGRKEPDVTEENLQSRLRGVILMSLSNKHGSIVLNTGNKSEMGMGYSTLYGDMVGGLGVLNDVTKKQVYQLAHYINRNELVIPASILTKPPSAELRPGQKDSDSLPEYDILDRVLDEYVIHHRSPEEIAKECGYSLVLVQDLITRIHRNEYKRRQASPGLRISEKAFSVGRRFPIVQRWTTNEVSWLDKNPQALESVKKGLEQSKEGKVSPVDIDFSSFADEEI